MNVFIAGGGSVGFHLARLLSAEKHDVTVIEANPNVLEQVDYALDVRTILGDVISVLFLKEAGVEMADLFISASGNDEINLIASATAKGLGAKQVVARVDEPVYVANNILYETVLGIDYILSPHALTALEITKYVEAPGIVATETFGKGLVHMRQVRVTESPTQGGKTLSDVCSPGTGVLLGLISRGNENVIPHGDSVVEPGDIITLIGHREKMPAIQNLFQGAEPLPKKLVVMGGGTVGLHLAQGLESLQRSVKLLDRNPARCRELAALLKKVAVVCCDATSRGALEEERLDEADVFVATTSDDERNIMAGILAKEVGAARTIAVVHHPDFAPLAAKLGIDHAVTPRTCIANRILKMVRPKKASSLAVLGEGQVEVIEFSVDRSAPILGAPLKEVRFPRGALLGAILRKNRVIVPSGDDEVQAGDSVILIVMADAIEAVQKLFQA